MSIDTVGFMVPGHVREYLRDEGFGYLPCDEMEPHIAAWRAWMASKGKFYDYRDTDGLGRVYEVHRRSIQPAMRVCREWGSLLLNDRTKVVCESQECTDWLAAFFSRSGFLDRAQETIVRAFGLGTAAWALWVSYEDCKWTTRVRSYDAGMVVPLTWDEGKVTECAFVTRAYYRGKPVDQLQMHLKGSIGYEIKTVCFDQDGARVEVPELFESYSTFSETPTFALVRPAIENTLVDMSPYGQSVFHDAIDAIQAVDLCFDALINEVDAGKMRIFLSDVMFDVDGSGKGRQPIPFGKGDCTVFRKVMSTEDTIQEFAPALRTNQQSEAFRLALRMLGDLTGLGLSYFDMDTLGYHVKTATEVSSDNSALMRNIKRHEHVLQDSLVTISKALLAVARKQGESLPDEGLVSVTFDDSIIADTAAEKAQDMREVGVTMAPWEFRAKWYGEDEPTARQRASAIATAASPQQLG